MAPFFTPTSAGQGIKERFPSYCAHAVYKKDGVDSCLKAAARGYVVVIQDVRGRYAPEGEWYPFKHEANDGYDTRRTGRLKVSQEDEDKTQRRHKLNRTKRRVLDGDSVMLGLNAWLKIKARPVEY